MGTPIIAGNWKMYKTPSETVEYIKAFAPLVSRAKARVLLAVPFTNIVQAVEAAKGSNIEIGAQNMHEQDHGAFTGEISAKMLKACGATFVLIGHSERRQIFHESNSVINKKMKKALECGLTPIFCFGETATERDQDKTLEVLERQISEGLEGFSPQDLSQVILAYEPVWAIGTGKTATPEIAEKAHNDCRSFIRKKWDAATADRLAILYGGSVKADNVSSLMAKADIDGALVGGASLDPSGFSQIVNFT